MITVERSHGEDGSATVDYSTSDGSATAGSDYQAVSGTLSWGPGDGSTKTFQIPIFDDGVAESNETVNLVLSNPTGGAILDSRRSVAVLTLIDGGGAPPGGGDDDDPGVLKFDEAIYQVIEGQPFALVTVERSHGEGGTVSVDYFASAGSATDGEDFQAVSGTLTWGHGDGSTKTFQVPIFDDTEEESTETINLVLADPTGGATIDPVRGAALLNLLDDDGSRSACVPGAGTLCLLDDRFAVTITYRTPNVGTGHGQAVPLSSQSGLFWFFDSANAEMLIKVIDGCDVPGLNAYWVFYAATTNVDFTLTVSDTATGVVKQYRNPLGLAAEPIQDVATFRSCPQ